ncbi:hypothetical protein TNCT_209901 [Trichonephila clavata]|uniref:Uncharacterized protein n=1 Tax=Trichonephila clavata TaxID=2740835 RepID=A0A8X6HZ19_TRICU|nr:hypothetical protein TNCT_209901 [Trichonephila clavata]
MCRLYKLRGRSCSTTETGISQLQRRIVVPQLVKRQMNFMLRGIRYREKLFPDACGKQNYTSKNLLTTSYCSTSAFNKQGHPLPCAGRGMRKPVPTASE